MILSPKSIAILKILAPGEELYGIQIMERSKGVLGRGTIYVTLAYLEEQLLVSSRQETVAAVGQIPRRLYRITDVGKLNAEVA